jgi:tetratricopeptide (TPR) repeat protein
VSEDTVSLTTWSEGLPDPNPWFDLFAGSSYPVYPYTLRDNFGTDTSSVAWRELVLENQYLRCRVFPDLGGHLYSCLDKINDVEIFYANPVVRKADVALRQAWVAMGIELNFPVGHSLVTVSPISFGTQQNADGSAGAWVADIDRQTGMEWRVEFVLRPGWAMLEQDVWLYNRGDIHQPYYWWSDSEEMEQDQNDTFILPTYLSGTHGFTFLDTWPISQSGIDMSVIKNYSGGDGLFAYGSNETFFAAYHPTTKTGTAHYATLASLPGKKTWTWGASGDPWVMAYLTQNFPSYIETQSGNTPNQETRLWLNPQQASNFTEYWMPARELDGISRANTSGVLYMGRTTVSAQPTLVVEFNVNQAIAGATVRILNGSLPAAPDTVVNLDPAVTYRQTVGGVASNVNYTFELLDSAGNVLMTHTENQYSGLTAADVTLGNQPGPYFGPAGSEQYYISSAAYNEQYTQYSFAEHDYNVGLALFPTSIGLSKGSGRLATLAARYDDAATLLAQVTAQTPSDHEAHFYLGLAYAALGRNDDAASEWTGIQSTADFGSAATFELASLSAIEGDLSTAAALFDTVNTVRAGAMETALLRRQGNTAAASAKLAQWRAVSPTDLFLRYEATLLGTPDNTLSTDLGAEPERVLNLADDYLRLGSYSDAWALLNQIYPTNIPSNQEEPGAVAPQNNALIAYYRGYCDQQVGTSPNADFAAASAMALPYIFPYRASSFAVLNAAIQANPNDATAHDLLGMLYMSRRQVDNAIAEWQTARSLNKALPTLQRNLGRAYLDIKEDVNSALPILSEGLTYEPSNSDLQDAYNRALAAQQANASCPFTLTSPAGGAVSIGPGTANITVAFTGPANCNWTVAGYGGWVSNATSDNGQGPGTVTYAVAANPGLTSRSQIIFTAGQPFTIAQAGASCSLSLTSASAPAPSSGGTITVGVLSPSDACSWTATTPQPWLSITSGASGGGGTVTIAVASNAGLSRSGVVTIANLPFTINQASSVTATHVRDFRGIGRSDVLMYESSSGTSYTALSNADGTFTYVYNLFSPGFDILRTGDFNGDGKADLVLYNSHTAAAYIGFSNGDGTFAFQSLFWSPGYDVVEAGDLNGDGKADVALYNSSTGTMYTGISDGTGGFTYKYTLVSTGFTLVRLADFNGDGKADIFLYNQNTGAAYLGIGDGAGGFSFHGLPVSAGYDLADIGDLNADGKTDLLLYSSASGNAATGISDGSGGFTFTSMLFSPGFSSARLADFSGDGEAGVIVYNETTATGYIGMGNGSGTFTFQSLFWSPGYDAVEPQDVVGNGKADVVLYDSTTGTSYTGIGNGAGGFTYTYALWGPGKMLAR